MAPPGYQIERTSTLPVSAEEAFAWHEREGAFERLSPPWERLEIIERSAGIHDGARTVIRVHVGPVPVRWVAVHRDYVRDRQFVDEQVEGPFAHWVHRHLFDPMAPDASRYTDRIEFAPPFGTLGAAAGMWLARPRAERMLEYRHETVRADLAAHHRFRDRAPLRVAITGASGLIGSALTPFLTTGGHTVTPVTRRRGSPDAIHWDPASGEIDAAAFEGLDAVVHLAGENVGDALDGRAEAAHAGQPCRRNPAPRRDPGTAPAAAASPGLGLGDGDLRRPRRRAPDRGRRADRVRRATSSSSWDANGSRPPSPPAPPAFASCAFAPGSSSPPRAARWRGC